MHWVIAMIKSLEKFAAFSLESPSRMHWSNLAPMWAFLALEQTQRNLHVYGAGKYDTQEWSKEHSQHSEGPMGYFGVLDASIWIHSTDILTLRRNSLPQFSHGDIISDWLPNPYVPISCFGYQLYDAQFFFFNCNLSLFLNSKLIS